MSHLVYQQMVLNEVLGRLKKFGLPIKAILRIFEINIIKLNLIRLVELPVSKSAFIQSSRQSRLV